MCVAGIVSFLENVLSMLWFAFGQNGVKICEELGQISAPSDIFWHTGQRA